MNFDINQFVTVIVIGLIAGAIIGAFLTIAEGELSGLLTGLILCVIVGLPFALIAGFVGGTSTEDASGENETVELIDCEQNEIPQSWIYEEVTP